MHCWRVEGKLANMCDIELRDAACGKEVNKKWGWAGRVVVEDVSPSPQADHLACVASGETLRL
eukprot:3442862-Amphidinium_carterae.2